MFRNRAEILVKGAIETLLLSMVALSPWAYGCVHQAFLFLVFCAIAALLFLWSFRIALEGRLTWRRCFVTHCLAGLFLFSLWQITPLPEEWVTFLSPGATSLRHKLLPEQPDILVDTEPTPSSEFTLSLYPDATRREALLWLAALLVFVLVLNNTSSLASLRRLSLVTLINGSLLSLFAIVQFFTSPPGHVYWTHPTAGNVFGPFICRNHFPCYVNMCIGLSLGLFAWVRSSLPKTSSSRSGRLLWLLDQPRLLWIGAALALMVSAVCLSLSRGGVLSLFAGSLLCLALQWRSSRPVLGGSPALVMLALGFVLAFWVGSGPIERRLAATWNSDSLEQSRLNLWARTLPLVGDFPLWGSGLGTFRYVELMTRTGAREDVGEADLLYENAHNDYLEAAVEGGLVRLTLSLLTIVGVFWLGTRAMLRPSSSESGALTLGALVAFTTLAIHSFWDFGIHIPAIALLATVIAAHLCVRGGRDREPSTLGLWGLAPVLATVALVALGVILFREGRRGQRIEGLRVAAQKTDGPQQALVFLEAVTRLDPKDASSQHEIARNLRDLYYREAAGIERRGRIVRAAQSVLAFGALSTAAARPPALVALPIQAALAAPRPAVLENATATAKRDHLIPSLLYELRARAACPLLPEPHLGLAAHADAFARSSTVEGHLDRARLLCPGNATLWLTCGMIEMDSGHPEQAARSWRRSLELSPKHHAQILAQCARVLSPEEIAQWLIPDDPFLLARTAVMVFPRSEDAGRRTIFLERARQLLEERHATLNASEYYLLGEIQWQLGDSDAALPSLRETVRLAPLDPNSHLLLARVCYEAEQFQDARRELLTVLTLQPNNQGARDLLKVVTHRLANNELRN